MECHQHRLKKAARITLRYFEILVSLWTFRILKRAEYPLKNAYPMWLLFFWVFLSRILESHSFYFHQMKHNRHSQTAQNLLNYSNSQHSNILKDKFKIMTQGNVHGSVGPSSNVHQPWQPGLVLVQKWLIIYDSPHLGNTTEFHLGCIWLSRWFWRSSISIIQR